MLAWMQGIRSVTEEILVSWELALSLIYFVLSMTKQVSKIFRRVFKGQSKAWVSAAVLQSLRIRIPPEAWMSVSCVCCALSRRDL